MGRSRVTNRRHQERPRRRNFQGKRKPGRVGGGGGPSEGVEKSTNPIGVRTEKTYCKQPGKDTRVVSDLPVRCRRKLEEFVGHSFPDTTRVQSLRPDPRVPPIPRVRPRWSDARERKASCPRPSQQMGLRTSLRVPLRPRSPRPLPSFRPLSPGLSLLCQRPSTVRRSGRGGRRRTDLLYRVSPTPDRGNPESRRPRTPSVSRGHSRGRLRPPRPLTVVPSARVRRDRDFTLGREPGQES